jgi:hypothetical protein
LILVREKEPEVDQRSQKMPSLPTGDQRFESLLQRRVITIEQAFEEVFADPTNRTLAQARLQPVLIGNARKLLLA